MSSITLATLRKMKRDGEKIACLTAYDASFARLVEAAGTEVVLVGDSLGMVVQGRESTVPVTLDEMVYHSAMVRRGCSRPLLVVDMPFLSYSRDPALALESAARLMKEGGAQVVKLEGGAAVLDSVQRLSELGVPVCAHLGLLPQSVHKLGGYRVQGREEASAAAILHDAQRLAEAGADLLVLECVPSGLAAEVTAAVEIPVIGIGAGPACDGQVLVLYDMLGITPGHRPKFSRDFLAGADSVADALDSFVRAVKSGEFPAASESFE